MASTDCLVCFHTFTEDLVPKNLECGHSVCAPCITKLLEGKAQCPTCRQKMTVQDVTQFPTNFGLLSLISDFNKLKLEKYPLKLRIEDLKNKFQDRLNSLIEREKTLTESLNSLAEEKTFITDGLRDLTALEKEDAGEDKVKELVAKLEEDFLDVSPNLVEAEDFLDVSPNLVEAEDSGLVQEEIKVENFGSQEEFLDKIYGRVRNGEKAFTVRQSEHETEYGRILTQGNKILVHSLSTKPTEKKIIAIKFQDMKTCLMERKVTPFLTLSGNGRGLQQTIFIETTGDPSVPQFLKLCSGECEGRSYKGSSYRKPGILIVDDYMRNGVAERGRIDYVASGEVLTKCDVGDVAVQASGENGFWLEKMTYADSNYCVIGNVLPPFDLAELISFSFNKVLDCGLSLALR